MLLCLLLVFLYVLDEDLPDFSWQFRLALPYLLIHFSQKFLNKIIECNKSRNQGKKNDYNKAANTNRNNT